MRTGRIAGAADIADRLPLFYFRADRNAALVLHVVVHAHVAIIMRNLNRPAVTGDPAVCGYLAALNRLDRRTGRRGNVNGLVPLRRCCAIACCKRLARTKCTTVRDRSALNRVCELAARVLVLGNCS